MKLQSNQTAFHKYFEMIPAVTKQLKSEAYRLRYQVYCLETGFEEPERCLNGLEIDEYDQNSVHFLIRHRKSSSFAATTRLILPSGNKDKLLPIERFTKISEIEKVRHIPRNNIAEASRFCVSKKFKKRKFEAKTLAGIGEDWEMNFSDDERRVFPHLTIALFACLVKMSDDHNIHYWYAVMEPALVRYFKTLGIYFISIGPMVNYHGMRRPYVIKVSELLDGVAKKNASLWEMMTNNGTVGNKLI